LAKAESVRCTAPETPDEGIAMMWQLALQA
jgi:hypothetical protein